MWPIYSVLVFLYSALHVRVCACVCARTRVRVPGGEAESASRERSRSLDLLGKFQLPILVENEVINDKELQTTEANRPNRPRAR